MYLNQVSSGIGLCLKTVFYCYSASQLLYSSLIKLPASYMGEHSQRETVFCFRKCTILQSVKGHVMLSAKK